MFVIACDSQKNDDVLFMVDRNKQYKSFWSYKLDDALILHSLKVAQEKVSKLKYNNPRVISLDDAQSIELSNITDKITFCEDPGDDEYWNGKDFSL